MPKPIFTAISSGIYKGKKLNLPSLATTRSTKSIVKGSVFDSLRTELYGKIFIECFGGSGVMALEALSNGAKGVYAVELDKKAYEITKSNFASLGVAEFALHGDCFAKVPQILANLGGNSGTILYIDPPFEIRDGFELIYQKVIKFIEEISKFEFVYLICLEHQSSVKFDEFIGEFCLKKSRKFGATTISFFVRKNG